MSGQRFRWTAATDPAVIRKAQSDAIRIAAELVRRVCNQDGDLESFVRRKAIALRRVADTLGSNVKEPRHE